MFARAPGLNASDGGPGPSSLSPLLARMAPQPTLGATAMKRVNDSISPIAKPAAKATVATGTSRQAASLVRLALAFEPNRGQADQPAKFIARGAGYTLFLTPTEAILALQKPHCWRLGLVPKGPPGSQ